MALYKYANELQQTQDGSFDVEHKPGETVPRSGIYICTNCRDEVACNAGDPFPPQNHRQHPHTTKAIRWKLLVATQNGP